MILKNFEKILLVIALFLCIMVFLILQADNTPDEQVNLTGVPQKADLPLKDKIIREDALLVKLEKPEPLDSYKGIIARNIFTENKAITVEAPRPQKKDNGFVVLNIEKKLFPYEYKGRLINKSKHNIAQINAHKRTYFAEEGNTIATYEVTRITDNSVTLEDKNSKEKITLTYLKPTQAKELVATVMDMTENKVYELEKGATLGSYNVLDITSDSVIISKGKEKVVITKD